MRHRRTRGRLAWRRSRHRRRARLLRRGTAAASAGSEPAAAAELPAAVGEGEGALNLVAWAGYVVGGRAASPSERLRLGHAVRGRRPAARSTPRSATRSDEMVQLMKTGEYDGVSASGDATLRLIAGGDVAAVNTALIPNYANVFEGLKNQPHNTVDGVAYGVPHGRGANLLMWQHRRRHDAAGQLERRLRSAARRTRARSPRTTTRSTSPMRPCT